VNSDPFETSASVEVRRKRVLTVEDWAGIHRAEGMPIKVIARVMIVRNTGRRALRSEGAPRSVRRPRRSMVDEVEPRI
jgi:hypothetical protein